MSRKVSGESVRIIFLLIILCVLYNLCLLMLIYVRDWFHRNSDPHELSNEDSHMCLWATAAKVTFDGLLIGLSSVLSNDLFFCQSVRNCKLLSQFIDGCILHSS